ncbi:MAG: GAF domain-containing protein [Anaerolineae bacterium]|nr:GAF domain-containing protein [Anaerolineae bacterium]
MIHATSQWLQLVAWFLVILEFILMLYILLLNPRHVANRAVALLFLVITINTLSVGLVLDPTPVYRIGLPLYVASSTPVVTWLLIVTVGLIKPEWMPRGRPSGIRLLWPLVYALSALPIVLTLGDVLWGTRWWYTPPVGYAGGFVSLAVAASGTISRVLRPAMTYVAGSLPVLVLVYLLIRDRALPAASRQMVWLLLVAQVVALALMSTLHGPVLTPLMALVVGALYTMTLAYAAFRQMISERRAQAGRVQTRLMVLLVVVVAPLFAGIVGVVLSRADGEIQSKADEGLAAANRAVAANTTMWLDLGVAALNQLVMLPPIVGMDAVQQKPILEAMAAAHSHMYLVSTTDPQGMNVARNDAGALTDYSDRPWYQGAIGGAPLTFQPLIGRTTGRPALVASAPIRQESGEIVGVGMFASELTDVAEQVQLSGVGEAGFSYVVDADDLVIAYPQQMPAGLGEISSTLPITSLGDLSAYPPVQALRAGSRGRITFTDESGQQWQAYVDEMKYGWGVVVQQPNEDYSLGLRRLGRIGLSYSVTGLLLLLGLVVLTVRQALGPVKGLTETATAIAGGDLLRVAPVESEDEFGVLARAFNGMTSQLRHLIDSLEQRVAERTADLERRSVYLQASAEVGQVASSILDVDALATQVVELIRERFGLYYVGLFLTDPAGEWAVLRAGTGKAGQAMLARGHRVEVGQGVVGWSIAHAQMRVALQAEADDPGSSWGVRVATPELPETRSEAALPLRSRGEVLGALTVQSAEAEAFDATALAALQTMADQVAVTLDNARLFAESQQALESARRAYGESSSHAWGALIRSRSERGYRYTRGRVVPIEAPPVGVGFTPAPLGPLRPPSDEGLGEDGGRLDIPLQVRDQVIGGLVFRKPAPKDDRGEAVPPRPGSSDPGGATWTREEIALLENLAHRLADALESARLYQATQRRAAQERLVGEVTARMRETLDLDTVLQTAVQEMRQALGYAEVEVLLDPDMGSAPGEQG